MFDPLIVESNLDKIEKESEKIAEAQEYLESLYRNRDYMYVTAQEQGATIAQIAERAGVTIQGVKYMLAKLRKGR